MTRAEIIRNLKYTKAINDTLHDYIPTLVGRDAQIPLECVKALDDLPSITPKESDKECENCAYYGVFSSDCARCDDDCTNWTPSGAKMGEQA